MSEYGIYVWPCYFLAFMLFAYHLISAYIELRRLSNRQGKEELNILRKNKNQ